MVGYSKPKNDALQPYIAYIHYYASNTPADRRLVLFPNVGAAITFYFNNVLSEVNSQSLVSEEYAGKHNAVLHINRTNTVEILERGRQERITVVFKPFGVNHFLASTIDVLSKHQNPSAIDIVKADPRYGRFVCELSKLPAHERIDAIEAFFASVFSPVKEERLENILEQFSANDRLTVIAARAATTTKTMDRLFHKHIGITPVEFKRILKFRSSLNVKLLQFDKSLNDLALESDYSDLPYMMKVYKKFTGKAASEFFNALRISAEGKYLYHIYQ